MSQNNLRDQLRDRYECMRGIETAPTANLILRLVEEHERMERFILWVQKILKEEDDAFKS